MAHKDDRSILIINLFGNYLKLIWKDPRINAAGRSLSWFLQERIWDFNYSGKATKRRKGEYNDSGGNC